MTTRVPKLGFLGVGWIGRHRMNAIREAGVGEIAAIAEVDEGCRQAALDLAPEACTVDDLEGLLELDLDGIVIATPSALHASQTMMALDQGLAVFCQKPLARTAAETREVIDAARRADRLLGLDLSYRHTQALEKVREIVRSGEIGRVYGVDLVFHNAYGPDKPWFYDRSLSGGGCVVDLGIHLVDAVLWTFDFPAVEDVSSRLYHRGQRLEPDADEVEDYAVARLDLEGGPVIELRCSWRLPAGQDAVIGADFYGTKGGAAFRNVNGSFYDFVAERYVGTRRERLVEPPDAWGGRAVVEWAKQLRRDPTYDASADRFYDSAAVVDAIYRRCRPSRGLGSSASGGEASSPEAGFGSSIVS